jgi:heptaprenyl diphosphate synthase
MIDVAQANGSLPDRIAYSESLQAVQSLISRTLLRTDASLLDVMQHLTLERGKNFRASLLLAAAADQTETVPTDAVTAAASLEILHLATLIHDDVIDEAATRRGQPSVQSRFGKKTAVIGGDYLFTVCFALIAGISARYPDKFVEYAKAMSGICLGEMRQLKHNGDTNLRVTSYLRIIAGKTAALFALAMYSGMILGGSTENESRLIARFGLYIGMLFQLADDCLDYEANGDIVKKSVKHDLAEGVITLPLIYSFDLKPELRILIQNNILSKSEIEEVVAQVISLGGVSRTKNLADRYYMKAKRLLDRLPDQNKKTRLAGILEAIKERNF